MGLALKFENRDEQLGIRLGDWETSDIRRQTSDFYPSTFPAWGRGTASAVDRVLS